MTKSRGLRDRHSKSRSKIYGVWNAMKTRCENPESVAYKNYGGRGITVCAAWQKFSGFYQDMGEPPAGMSLDRINNDLGYSRENCRWADRKTQARNQRGKRLITASGRTATIGEWAELTGLSVGTIWNRLKIGWDEADAVLLPKTTNRKGVKRGQRIHHGAEKGVVWTEPETQEKAA